MSLLEIKDLRVSYGGIEALKGISFHVEEGQIVTLIGANGAGKSTTLRAISGLAPVKAELSCMTARRSTASIPKRSFPWAWAWSPRDGACFPTLRCLKT